ncbi:MAG: PIN domain-containing protein [Bacteroidales bacterium]|nr:PIN domain-containing protein [Bacteroidales bacterium]
MKNIEIIDANIILRYLLNDHEGFSKKSVKIIEQMDIFLPFEVCAEVVYVLEKFTTFHVKTLLIR